MKQLFVSYELAVLTKEKGFNEPCFGYYNKKKFCIGLTKNKETSKTSGDCAAPLYQQLVDWFREKHNLHISSRPDYTWYDNSTRWIGTITHIKYQELNRFKVLWSKGHLSKVKKPYHYENSTDSILGALEEAFKLIK